MAPVQDQTLLCFFLNGYLPLFSSEPHLIGKISLGIRSLCIVVLSNILTCAVLDCCSTALQGEVFVPLLHTSIWFIDFYRGNDNNNSKHQVTCHSADIQEAIVPHSSTGEQFFHPNSSSGHCTVGKNCKLDTIKCPTSHVKGQYSTSIHQGKSSITSLVPFRTFNPLKSLITPKRQKSSHHVPSWWCCLWAFPWHPPSYVFLQPAVPTSSTNASAFLLLS